jgi:predicted metalloendopeptidase
LDKDKVDNLHKGITISDKEFFENIFHLSKFWRAFELSSFKEKIDYKSWTNLDLVAVVNAFYDMNKNIIIFPAGVLQGTKQLDADSIIPFYLSYVFP